MNVILFGATGMVGQGVLRECLLAPDVERVLAVGRSGTGQRHDKLRELSHADFTDFTSIESELTGWTRALLPGRLLRGDERTDYTRVTYDVTMAAAQVLSRLNPRMTFIYVSGAGPTAASTAARCGLASRAAPRTRS